MAKWSRILKWVAQPLAHPQRALSGAGQAVKNATIGAGVGYLGWEALVNDKPVLESASDLVVGAEGTQNIKSAVSDTVHTVGKVVNGAKEAISSVGEAASNVNQATSNWGGLGDFFRNISSGNTGSMFSNLFRNIGQGKVGGMSMLGLVASALLIFGRFGWLGKIAGAVMGMMLIGSNSRVQQIEQTQTAQIQQEPELRPQIHR